MVQIAVTAEDFAADDNAVDYIAAVADCIAAELAAVADHVAVELAAVADHIADCSVDSVADQMDSAAAAAAAAVNIDLAAD